MNKNENQLPNTFILGAAKAGTTTLSHLLKQHPQVFFSFDKEPMFFSSDEYFTRGEVWYAKTFFSGSEQYPIRAEATPHYLYWAEKVAPRIRQTFEGKPIKFVVILRNPIERAYSWYWNMVIDGRETLPFLDALKEEETRLKENWTSLQRSGSMSYGYFKGGCYGSQLSKYFELFPKKQFHILLLDDLLSDQEKPVRNLFRFLEINSNISLIPGLKNPSTRPRSKSMHVMVRNPSKVKNVLKSILPIRMRHKVKSILLDLNLKEFNYPPMDENACAFLLEKYQQEIADLSKLLDRDLSFWLQYSPVK